MKYIAWYHGYPLVLGNKTTGWRSCHNIDMFDLDNVNNLFREGI